MAFTSVITDKVSMGSKYATYGTYTNADGSTGGDIKTGLSTVDFLKLQPGGSAAYALAPSVNETFPLTGHTAVTVVNNANETGYWFAFGKI